MRPEVFEAMRPYFIEWFGAPSSLHQHGLRARDALEKARSQVAALIHAASAEEIIFTSGGTESANLAIKGVAYGSRERGDHIIVSEADHPAVLNSVGFLETQGFRVTRVRVNGEGFVDPEAIRGAMTDRTILVAMQHANHDIGTIQPVSEVAALTADRGIPLFVDAVASAGWAPVDVQAMGAQLVSISPHRFYGPKGVGVLYRHRRARMMSLHHGGNQEGGRRAGTENVPGIVGAGAAAELGARELDKRMAHTGRLQGRLWEGLERAVPYLRLNGPAVGAKRLSTNLNVSAEFVEGEALLLRLDMQGIAVAAGTSCASKALKVSHVLSAIGLEHSLALASVIITVGAENREDEIDDVIRVFGRTIEKLRQMSPMWDEFERGLVRSQIS